MQADYLCHLSIIIVMQHIRIFILILLCFAMKNAIAGNEIEIGEALAKKLIAVNIKGKGGYFGNTIALEVKNISASPLTVQVAPGRVFVSEDTTVQDLIIIKMEAMAIAPGSVGKFELMTMCTQAHNRGPQKGEKFNIGKITDKPIKRLAELFSERKIYTSTGQSAVWAVADNTPIEEIYGDNMDDMKAIAAVVGEIKGIPISRFTLTPKVHSITSINTSFEWRLDNALKNASLEIVDSAGNIIRKCFSNRKFEAGFNQWKFGLFHTQAPNSRFKAVLRENGEIVAERTVLKTDTVLELKNLNSNTVIRFATDKDEVGSVAVYDENDDLYFPIFEEKPFPKAHYNSTVQVKVDLPKEKKYKVKIINKEGKLLGEQPINEATTTKIYPPEKLSGVWNYTITTPLKGAKMVALNEVGEIVKVYFENSTLNPGSKNITYSFTHTNGPNAHFKMVLLDGEGKTVLEHKIK